MDKQTEHGVREAAYSNLPGLGQRPWILCFCGWESSRCNRNWEEAGEEFDEHLAEATR